MSNFIKALVDKIKLYRLSKDVKKSMREWINDEKIFKVLKREDFPAVEDEKLFHAAICWIYGRTERMESASHLEALAALPMPCQYVIAVNAVEGEVNNGGFNQYYFNDSHILTVGASEAFEAIGAPRLAEIVKKADSTYSMIKDQLAKFNDGTMESFMASYEDNPLEDCDTEYFSSSEIEDVSKLLTDYIRGNIDCFGD